MIAPAARRILLAVPTFIGITLIVFLLVHASPGGDAPLLDADPETGTATRAAVDNAPLAAQYARWLGRLSPVRPIEGAWSVAWPDLGTSRVRGLPCAEIVGPRLFTTLALGVPALVIIALVAVPLGVLSARRIHGTADRLISTTVVALWSFPLVWAAALAVTVLGSRAIMGEWAIPTRGLHTPGTESLPFLPARMADGSFTWGALADTLAHAAAPIVCLVYAGLAVLTRQTRSAMLEELGRPFVAAARAKGVPESGILWRHALSNSLLPIITLVSSAFTGVIAGSVIVESAFSIDGMGRLLLDAIARRDRELILAITAIATLITMASVVVADVVTSAVDPRTIREGRGV